MNGKASGTIEVRPFTLYSWRFTVYPLSGHRAQASRTWRWTSALRASSAAGMGEAPGTWRWSTTTDRPSPSPLARWPSTRTRACSPAARAGSTSTASASGTAPPASRPTSSTSPRLRPGRRRQAAVAGRRRRAHGGHAVPQGGQLFHRPAGLPGQGRGVVLV
jgi:hypothetical protein